MHPRKHSAWFVASGILAGAGIASLQGCDPDAVCGPCGTIATGEVTIAGNARLDGFFKAVADLSDATVTARGSFDANILALGELYGLTTAKVDASFVDDVIAELEADIQANAQAGLQVVFVPPRCEANIDVAVSAQAQCEAQADCDVMVDPGMVSVECEGSCQGGCSGSCSGEFSCVVEAPTVACEGQCEGACELNASAVCDGTCRGACMGECATRDGNGDCAGACDGMCNGTCEFSARAMCDGTCSGKCYVDQGSAQCTAEAECSGSCDAQCSGSCQGSATPPSASADCEASAKCQAQASAQAEANVQCHPPQLSIDFQASGQADAAFFARMGELKLRAVAIVQSFAQIKALIDGKGVNGEVVFKVAPLARIRGEIQGIIDAGISGDIKVPAGRIACVIPAFEESIDALADASGNASVTLQGGASFVAFLTGG